MSRSDYDDALDRAMHDTFDPEETPMPDPDAYSPADRPAPEPRLYARGTPVRNLRLDETRWAAVQDEATRTARTASDVMRDALDAYLDRRP